jgi:hypothetical protein
MKGVLGGVVKLKDPIIPFGTELILIKDSIVPLRAELSLL